MNHDKLNKIAELAFAESATEGEWQAAAIMMVRILRKHKKRISFKEKQPLGGVAYTSGAVNFDNFGAVFEKWKEQERRRRAQSSTNPYAHDFPDGFPNGSVNWYKYEKE